MEALSVAALSVYIAALLFIFLYSLSLLSLVLLYLKNRRSRSGERSLPGKMRAYPCVTVQLPVYNELYVVERLIDSVAAFDYPKDRLEIQVLDDSSDETSSLIESSVNRWKATGLDIYHVRRVNRSGYKAGALANGLATARGELIAIFDADFLPPPDFLLKTVQYFEDKSIGVVQTRWGHVNQDYSLLTDLQAFALDAHFTVEQAGRHAGNHFINFNGTGGIWRKECILDAGNWQSDTLTEDLDLSYRAQLKGWKFMYLEDVVTPAELPVTMSALKTQQFRWTKGGAECARKNLLPVLKSPHLSLATKLHAASHLLNSTVFLCIMLSAALSIPLLIIKHNDIDHAYTYYYASFSLLSLVLLGFFYWAPNVGRPLKSQLIYPFKFLVFLSVSMGFSLHNTVALIEAYSGHKIAFERTPKLNIVSRSDGWRGKRYLTSGINWIAVLEGLMACYFAWGVYIGYRIVDYGLIPFHLMLALGFGTVSAYSFWQAKNA